ncbi:MAG TPA: hypothetical protein DEE98_06360 [Elusimicrobia bacterium]|nr:MAG: hypothetical protein A2251_05710 [Elusimicrobia bacterium RIFOXYA2_FULL_47_53]OGS32098.1 MAG: hypothetical protein A2323_08485 [Elusimicrobia bacterium RIFOXYB2_FULL_46_23]HBU69993.1 hypothetical protein [Elusimicrobiota bacterium]
MSKYSSRDWENATREEDHQTDLGDLWIVPYADFMTVLMIFFLLMFAFAYNSKQDKSFQKIVADIQAEMGGEVNKDLIEKMVEQDKNDQIVSKFDDMIEKLHLKNFITVNSAADHIKVVFANPILFDVGQFELKKESKELMHEMAQIILKQTDNEIIVEGHTDNLPIHGGKFKSNWELSIARAMEVVNYFVKNEGLDPRRFAAAGYGEFRPVLSNDTEENRSQNRRIEIDILTARKQAAQ